MALKLDNSLLEELGLGALPEQEKQLLLRQIYEKLEMNVGMRLADQMSNEQLDAFERFVDANDDKGAFQWLETNFPNYKDVVNQEFEKLKTEIRSVAPQILASAQQNAAAQAQMPPQGAPMPGAPGQAGPSPYGPAPGPQQPAYGQPSPYGPAPQPQAPQYGQPDPGAAYGQPQPSYPPQGAQPAPGPSPMPGGMPQPGHLQPQYGMPQQPAVDDQQDAPIQPQQPQQQPQYPPFPPQPGAGQPPMGPPPAAPPAQ